MVLVGWRDVHIMEGEGGNAIFEKCMILHVQHHNFEGVH